MNHSMQAAMPGLDAWLTRGGDDSAHDAAIERLHTAVEKCGNDPDKLADLLIAVMGDKKAAEVISDYLLGDSDALNDRVVGWAS